MSAIREAWNGFEARFSDALSPIVVKEVRQSLKSRQFVYTYSAMLVAIWCWSIFGLVMLLPMAYYLPSGNALLVGYFLILTIPALLIIPLAVHRSLASESDEDTFELLSITALSARQIIYGKLASGLLQLFLLASILTPCFAFAYLLRGVDLFAVFCLLCIVSVFSIMLIAWGLCLAALVRGRVGQILVLIAQLGASVGALWMVISAGALWIGEGTFESVSSDAQQVTSSVPFIIGLLATGLIFARLLLQVAAARLSPVSENRSTPVRRVLLQMQAAFTFQVAMVMLLLGNPAAEKALQFGMNQSTVFWAFIGAFFLGESPHLSPRVRRDLAKSVLGRWVFGWMQPGPLTGMILAIVTQLATLITLMIAGVIAAVPNLMYHIQLALINFGYLSTALAIVAILVHVLRQRVDQTWILGPAMLVIVAFITAMVPYSIASSLNRGRAIEYDWMQLSNWFFTYEQWTDGALLPQYAYTLGAIGFIALCVVLPIAGKELHLPALAVPERIRQDDAPQKIDLVVDPLA